MHDQDMDFVPSQLLVSTLMLSNHDKKGGALKDFWQAVSWYRACCADTAFITDVENLSLPYKELFIINIWDYNQKTENT